MTDEKRENRKSLVRVIVTYAATTFLFLGGPALMVYFIIEGDSDEALNIFRTLLPVAAAIISFWFGVRGSNKEKPSK